MGKRTPEELEAHRQYMKKWRDENPEKAKAKEAAFREKLRADKDKHEAYKAYLREYQRKNKEVLFEKKREYNKLKRTDESWVFERRTKSLSYYHSLRRAALDHYGWKCACCGESQELFLSIDHINNDGAEHRRSIGSTDGNGKGAAIYSWLKKNNYPAGFQTLCMNCNHGKARNGGICPHVSTVKEQ